MNPAGDIFRGFEGMTILEELFRTSPIVPMAFTGLAILAGLVGYFYGPYWALRKVPGPPPIPVLGHLPLMAKHGPDLFSALARQYGPIFRFHMGRQPLVVVADPELCKEVGIKKFKDIPNRSMPAPIAASPLHQKGLFFTRDSRWSAMRKAIVSFYQPSHLASLIPTMQSLIELATERLKYVKDDEDVIFSNLSLQMAIDIVGQAAFGFDFGLSKSSLDHENADDEVSQFVNQHVYSTTQVKMDLSGSLSIIVGLLVPILQEPFRQILKRIPGTMDWKVDRTNKSLSARLDDIVRKRMKEKNSKSEDVLSLILNARESETVTKNVFTPDDISAVTYEHLLAGSATTSFTLSSILYLVAAHPEVEKKLIAEMDAFGPPDQIPTAHDLQYKFPYVDQVVKEAMRFYLLSPLIARETSKEVEIGGYLLPKGTWVWIAPGVLAKDPEHFPEPDKFKPERFDPNCEEEKERHPCAFIPFGLGPRSCVGQKFALQEIKLAMIQLYRKYVLRHSPNMENPLEFQYGMVLNFKHGVKLRVVKRN